jgi:hypothetical protein
MNKLSGGLLLFAAAVLYNCGSSDERVAVRESDGGEAGVGGDAGGPSIADPQGGAAGAEANAGPAGAGSAGAPDGGTDGGGGAISDAGAGGAIGNAGAAGSADGGEPVALPDGPILAQPYLCDTTGPFAGVEHEQYFYLDDFDDETIDLPGLTSSSTAFGSSAGSALVDSVDCDDGVLDGKCTDCNSLFSTTGSLELTFDAQVLGGLPTHVGMVWTDGAYDTNVTLTAYDASNVVIYEEVALGIGDSSNYGETEEDRFFGIVSSGGIQRVTISSPGGGIEIDHLQYLR